jgi:hypothetical protein
VELVYVAPLLMVMVPDVCPFAANSWVEAIRDMVNIKANAKKVLDCLFGFKFILKPSATTPPLGNIRFYQN